MPYSGPDDEKLPENVKKAPEKARSAWVKAWNAAHSACMAKDGKDCESHAFAIANSVMERMMEGEEEQHSREYFEAAITPTDAEGREWEVTIIGPQGANDLVEIDGARYVRSKNGRLYSAKALSESVQLWEGAKVYDNHLTDREFRERQGMRSVKDELTGVLTQPRWDEGGSRLVANYKVVDDGLARKLKNMHDQGVLGTIGLSIDTSPVERMVTYEGRQLPTVEGFKRVFSVDVVAEPAAGGGFNRLIAANHTERSQTTMNDEELKTLITKLVTEALAGTNLEAHQRETLEGAIFQAAKGHVTEAEALKAIVTPMVEALKAPAAPPPAQPTPPAPPAPNPEPDALKRVRALECQMARDKAIAAAKLPEKLAALVMEAFPDGRIFESAELEKFITRVKEAQAAQDPTGRVEGTGGRITNVIAGQDKAEVELLRLLAGNIPARAIKENQADYVKERISESVKAWINAGQPNYGTRRLSEWVYTLLGGDPMVDPRAYEAVSTSGMATIVKNAVNLILANDYSMRHAWYEQIVTPHEEDTIDTATLARIFGLATLPVVAEGASYTELQWADEEETATFVKKGGYVGVTLETLLQDKLNTVRSIPQRLANSWYNTLSSLVSGVFTVNTATGPALVDTGALFNSTAATSAGGHANLLTTALSFTAYGAVRLAMRKQTDRPLGAGEKLLIKPKFLLVPVDLEQTALQIRNSELYPGGTNNDINPYRNEFEVVVVPDWTDLTDWACVADPQQFPAIHLLFLRGLRVPALFTADSELAGAMFTNDELRYKVRLMTWRFSATYDCAPVSDWRPLHKSNVA